MTIVVGGKSCSPISSGESTTDKSLGESFDDGWERFGFLDSLKDLVSLRNNAARALGRQVNGVQAGEVLVDCFSGANTIFWPASNEGCPASQ